MRSARIAISLVQPHEVADARVFEPLAASALGSGRYERWEESIPPNYQPHPGELRRARTGVHGAYGLIELLSHRAPGQVAMHLAASRPDCLVILHLGAEIDEVPGLGRVQRKGPGNAETLKLYLGETPWLKIGDAKDDDVKYPVPNLVAERLPIVMEKLRPVLGEKAAGLESILESGLLSHSLNPMDVLRFLEVPEGSFSGLRELVFLRSDSPLIRNSPSGTTS